MSSSGNFAGCPSGAGRVTSSNYSGNFQGGAGLRTLYRCGETFTASTGTGQSNSVGNSSLVGGFGSCQDGANPAIVNVNAPIHTGNNGGWRVRDIRYIQNYTPGNMSDNGIWYTTQLNGDNFLFFRSESLETPPARA